MNLTECQEKAVTELESWLLNDDEPEIILSGGAGMGKSTVTSLVLDNTDELTDIHNIISGNKDFVFNDVSMVAPTNKAASVINGKTLLSHFGITLYNDYNTGEVKLNLNNVMPMQQGILVIDESSMVDKTYNKIIDKYTSPYVKKLYVGDQYQLKSVKDGSMPVFEKSIPIIELNTPCRQDPNSHLYKEIDAVRNWVKTGNTHIPVPGKDIYYIHDAGLVDFINNMTPNDKIISMTNKSVINMNEFVRFKKGRSTEFFEDGEVVLSNTTVSGKNVKKQDRIYTDCAYTITCISPIQEDYGVQYRTALLNNVFCKIAVEPLQLKAAIKQAASNKDWHTYFFLKEEFVDVRSGYAITTHKSQGSTYDRVLINLANFRKCPQDLDRLLYVAMSRAKYEIFLYGTLN